MIDISIDVLKALGEDPVLLNLTEGKNKTWQFVIPQGVDPPFIRIAEINNYNDNFADDNEVSSAISYQIDMWDKSGKHNEIANEIERIMKSLGFSRYYSVPTWDTEVLSVRKIMRFRTTKMI
ncbi:uncharacterized protein DUF3168 [Scopulibacillus darangshiensis]|uniref:Uncharacterized protein DUF3168 n=1 Tax=Scopulibacillus darangshiensis TaxID=442528 RepID=A0A4R2PE34_9BACL|nr:DUF3168 domain-containing protein [Scopulibacillus darangshiensis]TCP32185.1 uncharacterized protein DUF3168 [Scopulibacillus darangshiensis]